MLNKNERMEKLNERGIDTGKYFTVDLENGAKVHIVVDENGNPTKVNDPICEQIIEDGYVKNTKLHRRFVMAQMFEGLNYNCRWSGESGYTAWLKRHGLCYAFNMMTEEARVLSLLEKRDKETFLERSSFFTKDVIAETIEDYIEKLIKHIEKQNTYKCKGVPYKKIKGRNIFESDLHKKIYAPMFRDAKEIRRSCSYDEIYNVLIKFKRKMISLPWDTPQGKAWIDAYKGEGAYYTLKNLVMFHNCAIIIDKFTVRTGISAVKYLNEKLVEYQGEGWRMFGLMKKVIEDNNFDFYKRMSEIYDK